MTTFNRIKKIKTITWLIRVKKAIKKAKRAVKLVI